MKGQKLHLKWRKLQHLLGEDVFLKPKESLQIISNNINVWYIYLHEWLILMVNVGSTSPIGSWLQNSSLFFSVDDLSRLLWEGTCRILSLVKPLVFPDIAGWDTPMFNRKCIDSIRAHLLTPAGYVKHDPRVLASHGWFLTSSTRTGATVWGDLQNCGPKDLSIQWTLAALAVGIGGMALRFSPRQNLVAGGDRIWYAPNKNSFFVSGN